ncbi:MAG: nitrite reductase small subunit NirD [Pseudomonadota bacterium]
MTIATGNWVAIGNISDIPELGSRRVMAGKKTIAVFRTGPSEVFAIEDSCPHKGGPLSQGIVHDGCVTCPLHNWVISLSTGEAQGADEGRAKTYPTMLDGETILLDAQALT